MKTLARNILSDYNYYLELNERAPNVAYVKVRWKSDSEESDYTETIAIDGVDSTHKDEDILFYCNSVQSLIGLTVEKSGEDFYITNFIGFDNIDD